MGHVYLLLGIVPQQDMEPAEATSSRSFTKC
jgi:hypothetical protein